MYTESLITTVSERGQVSIPSEIRQHYHIKPNSKIAWLETPEGIFIMPIPEDPIESFRGKSKGLFKVLMEDRAEERKRK
ncbi:MAG: AbrB/MazE/SpoVT family DNA-binding domain-containing protein [Deltaproteobacteria bacterium]|nr:MAG: AbrB/MazE/SpoVT family DNA-binding domain-containing protein [Deltaproteobacteria bacterium]